MNPLMMLGNNNNNMMMSALGAMMRGENPRTFIKNLANSNPQLQGMDLDNLEATAKSLCEKNGVDMNQLAEKIKGFADSHK